jgi:hypothetical protein
LRATRDVEQRAFDQGRVCRIFKIWANEDSREV